MTPQKSKTPWSAADTKQPCVHLENLITLSKDQTLSFVYNILQSTCQSLGQQLSVVPFNIIFIDVP